MVCCFEKCFCAGAVFSSQRRPSPAKSISLNECIKDFFFFFLVVKCRIHMDPESWNAIKCILDGEKNGGYEDPLCLCLFIFFLGSLVFPHVYQYWLALLCVCRSGC